jgi:hypothetical protein
MAIRNYYLHISELRSNPDAAVSLSCPPDFACVGFVIRQNLAVGEAHETTHEIVSLVARYVDPVIGNRLQRRVCRGREVPIQLHLHTTGLLNDGVNSDGVFERFDDDLRSGSAYGLDRLAHIGHQVSGALLPKRKGHWSLVGEDRQRTHRR